MIEHLKDTVAGLQFDDKGAETGSRVTTTGVSQDREETAGNNRTEDTDAGIEDEGEGRCCVNRPSPGTVRTMHVAWLGREAWERSA